MKALMVQVERAVRTVRAPAGRKDRMREELLAHVTGIFEEERARLGDEQAALEQALCRFGEPAELTRQLQETVSGRDRNAYLLERWFGWRPPETTVRFLLRLSVLYFVISTVLASAVIVTVVLTDRSAVDLVMRLRVGVSFLLLLQVDLFLLGLLYTGTRDALCGGPGTRRSWLRAAAFAALSAVVVPASGLALGLLAGGSLADGLDVLYLWWPFAVLVPAGFVAVGLFDGPNQIRHAEWCCLDIGQ